MKVTLASILLPQLFDWWEGSPATLALEVEDGEHTRGRLRSSGSCSLCSRGLGSFGHQVVALKGSWVPRLNDSYYTLS